MNLPSDLITLFMEQVHDSFHLPSIYTIENFDRQLFYHIHCEYILHLHWSDPSLAFLCFLHLFMVSIVYAFSNFIANFVAMHFPIYIRIWVLIAVMACIHLVWCMIDHLTWNADKSRSKQWVCDSLKSPSSNLVSYHHIHDHLIQALYRPNLA